MTQADRAAGKKRLSRAERVARYFHRVIAEANGAPPFDEIDAERQIWWTGHAEEALAPAPKGRKG